VTGKRRKGRRGTRGREREWQARWGSSSVDRREKKG
jgi:hypothetical protein